MNVSGGDVYARAASLDVLQEVDALGGRIRGLEGRLKIVLLHGHEAGTAEGSGLG